MRKTTAIILMLLIASFLFAHQRIANANPGADLIVENITLYPSAPVDGDSVTVYVTVKNQGDANVTTDFWVPIWIDEAYVTSVKVTEDLTPNETTAQGVITATWTASPGDHDFKAESDGGRWDSFYGWRDVNLVAEDDELNNEKTVSIYVGYPDLIVDDLFLEPALANDGEIVQIRAIIKNIGTTETKRDFYVPFFIDDAYLESSEVTQNLAPNETTSYPTCPTVSWTLTPGQHEYKVKADGGRWDSFYGWRDVNIVQESNETNNELAKTLQVGYSDLVIAEVYWAPQYPKDGETITFYATVKNNGLSETTRDFYVTFLRDADVYVGAQLVTANLAPGENSTVSVTWVGEPGDHEIKVKADGGRWDSFYGWRDVNVVQESNETNNMLTKAFYVSQCDYIISDISWSPINPAVGQSVTIYGKVKNVGPGSSVRDFYVTFFVNGSYVGATKITEDLAQGEVYTVSCTWTFTAGIHLIKVQADGGRWDSFYGWRDVNVIVESSEDNNIRIENMSDCDASIVLSHSDGYAGMQIIINGTGFKPNSLVTILWDALNSSITTFSNEDGEILTQFTIPNTYLVIHDISATDGEDTAPGVNFELRRARVSTPVLYDPGDVDTDGAFIVDCSDATSELGEVTKYEFQRSLNPVFTSPTTNSRSESRLQLSNLGNGTYYFRVRAWDEDHGLYSFWSNTESITVLVFSQVVLTVRVSDNGVPIPNANVTVRLEDGTFVASKLTNQSGYTTFTLTPGIYNIASQTAGYSINQTITSDTLIVFDPLAKVPEFQTAISMLIVAIVSAAFTVLSTKKRRKNF